MTSAPGSWAVDLKFHTLSGLPQSDPNISVKVKQHKHPSILYPLIKSQTLQFFLFSFKIIQVTSPDDEDHCKFSTARLPSLRGTAFLGAWTTVIIKGSNQLQITVEEHLSVVHILSPSRFKASSIINLKEYATPDSDIEKCRQGFIDIDLVLVPNKRKKKQLKLEEAEENEARRQNNKAKLGSSSSSVGEEAKQAVAVAIADGSGDRDVDKTTPTSTKTILPANITKYKRSLVRSQASLVNPVLLRLRLSLRVTPLAQWITQKGSYHNGGGALELDIFPIPVQSRSYAHGGFMGLACSLLEDPVWKGILESEDPNAWSSVQQ